MFGTRYLQIIRVASVTFARMGARVMNTWQLGCSSPSRPAISGSSIHQFFHVDRQKAGMKSVSTTLSSIPDTA